MKFTRRTMLATILLGAVILAVSGCSSSGDWSLTVDESVPAPSSTVRGELVDHNQFSFYEHVLPPLSVDEIRGLASLVIVADVQDGNLHVTDVVIGNDSDLADLDGVELPDFLFEEDRTGLVFSFEDDDDELHLLERAFPSDSSINTELLES